MSEKAVRRAHSQVSASTAATPARDGQPVGPAARMPSAPSSAQIPAHARGALYAALPAPWRVPALIASMTAFPAQSSRLRELVKLYKGIDGLHALAEPRADGVEGLDEDGDVTEDEGVAHLGAPKQGNVRNRDPQSAPCRRSVRGMHNQERHCATAGSERSDTMQLLHSRFSSARRTAPRSSTHIVKDRSRFVCGVMSP